MRSSCLLDEQRADLLEQHLLAGSGLGLIRRGRDWSFTRRHAMHVLGLAGTGALRPIHLRGVVRVERGGIWFTAPGRRARAHQP